MHACVIVCVCPLRLLISGMIWTPYDRVNKFYSFYMAAIVDIVSRGTIEAHHGNQPNKSKLALCTLRTHFNRHLKQLYTNNKMECFSYKGGCSICGCTCIKMLKRKELV